MPGFLDLSAELRNEIYVLVAEQEPNAIIKSKLQRSYDKQRLLSRSALIAVNKQINSEHYEVLYNRAFKPDTVVTATVKDFDFHHVTRFFQISHDHTPSHTHTLISNSSKPKIHIDLQPDDIDEKAGDRLGKWFKFLRSSQLKAKYKVTAPGCQEDSFQDQFFTIEAMVWQFAGTDIMSEMDDLGTAYYEFKDQS